MRSVILLPIMGEKLLLTIPEKYIIYLVAVRFDCTRQSSSVAISKEYIYIYIYSHTEETIYIYENLVVCNIANLL